MCVNTRRLSDPDTLDQLHISVCHCVPDLHLKL